MQNVTEILVLWKKKKEKREGKIELIGRCKKEKVTL